MFKNLIPWKKGKMEAAQKNEDSFMNFHKQMDQMFNQFLRDFDMPGFAFPPLNRFERGWMKSPDVDVDENEKEIRVTADLPGIDEKDLDVSLEGNSLTLKGEKKEEKSSRQSKGRLTERCYGSFERRITVPSDQIDPAKVKASMKKGVLTVLLPKIRGRQENQKKIAIQTED